MRKNRKESLHYLRSANSVAAIVGKTKRGPSITPTAVKTPLAGKKLAERDEQDSYLVLLNAQQSYQQAVIGRAQAQMNRYADTAALFQSLGGSAPGTAL